MTDAAGSSTVRVGATTGVVLPLLAVTQFLMTVDATVMNVSIGALVEDLDTSVTAIQGVITAYTLIMAASMISGGKLGDILGRRRALRIGLVVYATGSAITAVAPNVGVLLLGWSVLEGLGAALIMPTVVALVAGNFVGRARAAAYSTLAASAAVAAAAGPIIGGFVTANFTWRWVFVVEVLIAGAIIAMSGRIPDVEVDERPRLDLVGAVLSAAGLGLVVFGVLQSSSWGWVDPRIPDGPDATPAIGGISLTVWLVLAGLLTLWVLVTWLDRLADRGGQPLFDPALLGNRQLRSGLVMLLLQYLMTNGLFFMVPLFLSIVLGLSAFETGLHMLPLSIALVVVAPSVPRFLPNAPPRRLVRGALVLMVGAAGLLAVLLGGRDPDASVVIVPFVLVGVAFGLLASQLGNVVVSAVPVERSSEVGGLQYTAQNLGNSLGTALVGAVVIGGLAGIVFDDLSDDPGLDDAFVEEVGIEMADGIEFVSDADLARRLDELDLPAEEADAIDAAYEGARLRALQNGSLVIAFVAAVGLFATGGVPTKPITGFEEDVEEDVEA